MSWQEVALILSSLAVFVMLVWAGVMIFAWRSVRNQFDADRHNWRQTERRGPKRVVGRRLR